VKNILKNNRNHTSNRLYSVDSSLYVKPQAKFCFVYFNEYEHLEIHNNNNNNNNNNNLYKVTVIKFITMHIQAPDQ
jgi:hypothetical protein